VARPEIRRGLSLVSAAEDPEQAYIRRCGAELALICDQIPIPLVSPLALRARPLTTEDIDAIRAPADPAAAGYQLAKRITGLPDGLVALIGGDQITDTTILGCLVPEPVRPARTAPATSRRSTAASHGPNRRSEATDIRVSRSTAISR
jgi:hypothetical protein